MTLEELELKVQQLESVQMTVTDDKGLIPEELIGEICPKTITVQRDTGEKDKNGKMITKDVTVKDPFTFYASSDIGVKVNDVRIVMPLGGAESGIFRQPQIGEKILVNKNADGYFLLGFIPTFTPGETEQNDSYTFLPAGVDKKDIDLSKGQVLRYKNTGENYNKYPYSEIGFYTKKYRRTKDEKETGTFLMNELDLISTGDIHNLASEGYSISAETFGLDIGGEKNENASISIDAEGNITINAISSIKFTVGNTSMKISSDEFSVISKLINTPLDNTYDASMSLKALKGFSASGLSCSLDAVKKASINDAMGGSISTNMGLNKIVGREIAIKTYNNAEYNWLTLFNAYDFIANTIAYGTLDKNEKTQEKIKFALKVIKFTRDSAKEACELIDEYRELEKKKSKSDKAEKEAIEEEQKAQQEAQKNAERKTDQANKDKEVQKMVDEYKDKNKGATDQQIAQRRREYEENYDREFDQRTFDANWIQSHPQISKEDALALVKQAEKTAWADRRKNTRDNFSLIG